MKQEVKLLYNLYLLEPNCKFKGDGWSYRSTLNFRTNSYYNVLKYIKDRKIRKKVLGILEWRAHWDFVNNGGFKRRIKMYYYKLRSKLGI